MNRQSRAYNIILFNVPDSSLPGYVLDTSIVEDIFNTISIRCDQLVRNKNVQNRG